MQRATCTGIRVRSPADARIIFHAVLLGILSMVTRRLDNEERGLISPGSVYVWEERGPHAELTGVGIERWTDGIRWGPSRVREGFLFYHEKSDQHAQHLHAGDTFPSPIAQRNSRNVLIKQTYTVFVDTPTGQRKWHLIAYFTEASIDRLRSVDDIPQLASVQVPNGKYRSARSAKGRPDHLFNHGDSPEFPRLEYISYNPKSSPLMDCRGRLERPRSAMAVSPELRTRRSNSDSVSSDESSEGLAPLVYLENLAPPRRHPIDEKALMLFTSSRML